MAKITLGPIVQSVRGTIGGITFRKVGAKFYATPKSAGPVSPGKNSGEHVAFLKQITSSWRELDPAVKQFWERYHALALPRNPRTGHTLPTPYALYLCYQSLRVHCGVDMLTASVPDPPIFTFGTLSWDGPYWKPELPVEGYVQMYWKEQALVDAICVFCAATQNGRTPSRYQRKIFPTPTYPVGRVIANTNSLVYDKMGYPPGISGLYTHSVDVRQDYLLSGWGIHNDLIFYTQWTPPEVQGDWFKYPPAAPTVYT